MLSKYHPEEEKPLPLSRSRNTNPNHNPNPNPNPHPNQVRLSSVAYFEVTIGAEFEPGGEHSDLCVAVGLCTDRFPLDGRMPGWDYHSCGFHGNDG